MKKNLPPSKGQSNLTSFLTEQKIKVKKTIVQTTTKVETSSYEQEIINKISKPKEKDNPFSQVHENLVKEIEIRKTSPEYQKLKTLIAPFEYFINLINNHDSLEVIGENLNILHAALDDLTYFFDKFLNKNLKKIITTQIKN